MSKVIVLIIVINAFAAGTEAARGDWLWFGINGATAVLLFAADCLIGSTSHEQAAA